MATVVVMDDDNVIAKMIATIVESQGHQVFIADNVPAAWDLLAKKPNLMILDIDLPNETGIDLVMRMRGTSEYEQIPVLFVTAFAERARPLQATGRGAVDIVEKPFSVQELTKILQHMLENTAKIARPMQE
ncbi:MAG: response regulator [Deltaproteobacteria bacterium]|nr:response regulator [Deltaproteobacteria bacterium]